MTSHTRTVPPRIVAPGGPVTRALAVMAAADPDRTSSLARPMFAFGRLDATAIAVVAGCLACWIAPAALWMGGVL